MPFIFMPLYKILEHPFFYLQGNPLHVLKKKNLTS